MARPKRPTKAEMRATLDAFILTVDELPSSTVAPDALEARRRIPLNKGDSKATDVNRESPSQLEHSAARHP